MGENIDIGAELVAYLNSRGGKDNVSSVVDTLMSLGVIHKSTILKLLIKNRFQELRKKGGASVRSCILDCALEFEVGKTMVESAIYKSRKIRI